MKGKSTSLLELQDSIEICSRLLTVRSDHEVPTAQMLPLPNKLMNETITLLQDNQEKLARAKDLSEEVAAEATQFATMAKQFAASSQKRSWW